MHQDSEKVKVSSILIFQNKIEVHIFIFRKKGELYFFFIPGTFGMALVGAVDTLVGRIQFFLQSLTVASAADPSINR